MPKKQLNDHPKAGVVRKRPLTYANNDADNLAREVCKAVVDWRLDENRNNRNYFDPGGLLAIERKAGNVLALLGFEEEASELEKRHEMALRREREKRRAEAAHALARANELEHTPDDE